jgi:hypothetical protein
MELTWEAPGQVDSTNQHRPDAITITFHPQEQI